MAIRVLIADDQPEVRSAVRLVLDADPEIEVVDEVADGAEAVRLARRHRPDVTVIDIRMPRMDGIAAIRALTDPAGPCTRAAIALTTFDLDDYLFGALRAGATGFLLKDSGPALLLDAIRVADRGHGLIDPQLTCREREVLLHVARGLSNAEIARALWIEEGTVKTHVARILAKLGLRTRVHAVIYSYEHGLMSG